MIPAPYDGLVLVHFDWQPPRTNPHYEENIRRLLREYARKPKYLIPSNGTGWADHDLHREIRRMEALHLEGRTREALCGRIAARVGKAPRHVTLAFGGMWGEVCVQSYASFLCRNIIASRPYTGFRHAPITGLLGKAVVIDDITEYQR